MKDFLKILGLWFLVAAAVAAIQFPGGGAANAMSCNDLDSECRASCKSEYYGEKRKMCLPACDWISTSCFHSSGYRFSPRHSSDSCRYKYHRPGGCHADAAVSIEAKSVNLSGKKVSFDIFYEAQVKEVDYTICQCWSKVSCKMSEYRGNWSAGGGCTYID